MRLPALAILSLLAFALGLALTVLYNVFNGRSSLRRETSDGKTTWAAVLYLRGLLIYPSIVGFWYFFGWLMALSALGTKVVINRSTWRRF